MVNSVSTSNITLTEESLTLPAHTHVCMHILNRFQIDVRAKRASTALARSGCTVSVVDVASDATVSREEYDEGITIKHMPVAKSFSTTRFKRGVLLKAALLFIRGTLHVLRTPADVYHALDLPALPACYIASRIRRKPLIFESYELPLSTLHSQEISRSRRILHALIAPLLRHVIPRCASVIVVSSPIVEEMKKRYPGSKFSLIRNILPYKATTKTNRIREKLGLGSHVRIALYQGYLQPDRRLDVLVRAARYLEPNTVIVMMGKAVGTTLQELESLIEQEGVADRVKIIPAVPYEELLDWTSSADLGLVLLSQDYSLNIKMILPNKLFEFLMAGLPVLTSQLEAVIEVIDSYDAGRVVPSLAPEDIAKAIQAMVRDETALKRMHQNALIAAKDLCWEKESQQLIKLYQDVTRAPGKRVG